jgi:hypothetical protein
LVLGATVALVFYFRSSFPSYVVNRLVFGNVSASNWKIASGDSVIRYYQWRLRKLNASENDIFRSHEYVKFMATNTVSCDGLRAFEQLMLPVIEDLCFRGEPSKKVDDVLRLIMSSHSPLVDTKTIPPLIQCLWTDDADNRLRIHQTLKALQQADYPQTLSQKEDEAFKAWVPGKDEKSGDVAVWVRNWSAWWNSTQASQKTSCSPPPSGVQK